MGYVFQGYQLITWYWFVTAFSGVVVGIRLYIDYLGLRKVAVHRDVTLVLALLLCISMTAMDSVSNDWDTWNITSTGETNHPEVPAHDIAILKMAWATGLISFTMYCLLKSDLLFLYHSLAPKKSHPKLFNLILVGWFFVGVNWICTLIWFFTTCIPFSNAWSLDPDITCYWGLRYIYLVWTTHLISEVAIYIIPLIIINQLDSWNFSRKLSASAMFLIGLINILTIACAIGLQVVEIQHYSSLSLDAFMGLYTYSMFQTGIQRITGFFIVCMPQVQSFYRLLRGKIAERRRKGSGMDGPTAVGKDVEEAAAATTPPMWRRIGNFKEMSVNINVSTIGVGSCSTVAAAAADSRDTSTPGSQ